MNCNPFINCDAERNEGLLLGLLWHEPVKLPQASVPFTQSLLAI